MTQRALNSWIDELVAAGHDPEFRPGLLRDEIVTMCDAAGIAAPESLIELYEFANGADAGALFLMRMRPLHEALEAIDENLELLEDEDDDPQPPFRASYIPFVENDPMTVLDTQTGQVLTVWWDDPTVVAHPDLASFVEAQREELRTSQLVITDGTIRRKPKRHIPQRITMFYFYARQLRVPPSSRRKVAALPELLRTLGTRRVRIEYAPIGRVLGNNGLEHIQKQLLEDLINDNEELAPFDIRFVELGPGIFDRGRHDMQAFDEDVEPIYW